MSRKFHTVIITSFTRKWEEVKLGRNKQLSKVVFWDCCRPSTKFVFRVFLSAPTVSSTLEYTKYRLPNQIVMLYLLNLGQGCFISQLYKPRVIDNPPICDAEIMEAFHAKKIPEFFSANSEIALLCIWLKLQLQFSILSIVFKIFLKCLIF